MVLSDGRCGRLLTRQTYSHGEPIQLHLSAPPVLRLERGCGEPSVAARTVHPDSHRLIGDTKGQHTGGGSVAIGDDGFVDEGVA